MANWKNWTPTRDLSPLKSAGYEVGMVNDAATGRYLAKNEAIAVARRNAAMAALSQRNAQKVARERAAKVAEAVGTQAAIGAAQAATFSSRLLAEFESRRSQRRALAQRKEDTSIGQIQAGFSTSGIESLGAQAEAQRQSSLERIVFESQLNTEKERILQRGQSGITGAVSSAIGAQGSLSSTAIQPRVTVRATNSFNPYKPSQYAYKGGRLPIYSKGF